MIREGTHPSQCFRNNVSVWAPALVPFMSPANMPTASRWPFAKEESETLRGAEALGHGGFSVTGRCRVGGWSGGARRLGDSGLQHRCTAPGLLGSLTLLLV